MITKKFKAVKKNKGVKKFKYARTGWVGQAYLL
jgi:hypothetical protein